MQKYMVLNLPIEPIEKRYSSQWDKWFKEAFDRHKVPTVTITAEAEVVEPPTDKFLDPFGTFLWKNEQLAGLATWLYKDKYEAQISDQIRYVVFAHDGWFPGLAEMVAYLRDLAGLDIKLATFWHAGSYDKTDLLGMKGCHQWACGSEWTWLKTADLVFVGSEYHADKIRWFHPTIDLANKLHIVGVPVEVPAPGWSQFTTRKRRVVWPHRISEDKHPEVFDKLKEDLSCLDKYMDVEFVRTMDLNLSKDDYYQLLAQSKVAVSTASHENFGISMVEAAMLGCYPVVPNDLAYQETMPMNCRYSGYAEMRRLVKWSLEQPEPYNYPFKELYQQERVTDEITKQLIALGEGQS